MDFTIFYHLLGPSFFRLKTLMTKRHDLTYCQKIYIGPPTSIKRPKRRIVETLLKWNRSSFMREISSWMLFRGWMSFRLRFMTMRQLYPACQDHLHQWVSSLFVLYLSAESFSTFTGYILILWMEYFKNLTNVSFWVYCYQLEFLCSKIVLDMLKVCKAIYQILKLKLKSSLILK